MSQVRKTIHTGLNVLGDAIVQTSLNVGTSGVVGTTLYTGGALTVAAGGADITGDSEINGALDVFDGTSEVTYQNGIFRVSLVGGTTLFRLTDTDGMDINNDVAIGVGKTLKVDNIERADSGLGSLDIEGISVEGSFLYVDNIAEKTAANGIRIDLLKVKDNTLDLISGTEIIIEENVRIRDGKALEVSAIYEADLSSDITLYSSTIINSSFTANYAVKFANLAVGSNHQVLVVDTAGTVSAPNLLVVNTASNPDRLFINGDIQLNAGPGTGGAIDLTNGFGRISNNAATFSDANTHVILSSVYTGAIFLLLYSQTNHPPATEQKGAILVTVMEDDTSGNVRVRSTVLGSTGTAITVSYANDTSDQCDITVKGTSTVSMRYALLRIG